MIRISTVLLAASITVMPGQSRQLYVWGSNSAGQYGDGTTLTSNLPIESSLPNFTTVVFGGLHAGGIAADGRLYMWGTNNYGQLGTSNTSTTPLLTPSVILAAVRDLSLGFQFSAALLLDGRLLTWGSNSHGQLGCGYLGGYIDYPFQVYSGYISGPFTFVTLGYYHSAALCDGTLFMWGYGSSGQLGSGTFTLVSSPVQVTVGFSVSYLSLGHDHSGAIASNGALYMWGSNANGQVGVGGSQNYATPIPVLGGYTFCGLSLGMLHTGALTTNGYLFMWGGNSNGQVGVGSNTNMLTPQLVKTNIVHVSLGGDATGAITDGGKLYTWGKSVSGQLGTGSGADSWIPTPAAQYLTFETLALSHSAALGFAIDTRSPSPSRSQRPSPQAPSPSPQTPSPSPVSLSPSPSVSPHPIYRWPRILYPCRKSHTVTPSPTVSSTQTVILGPDVHSQTPTPTPTPTSTLTQDPTNSSTPTYDLESISSPARRLATVNGEEVKVNSQYLAVHLFIMCVACVTVIGGTVFAYIYFRELRPVHPELPSDGTLL